MFFGLNPIELTSIATLGAATLALVAWTIADAASWPAEVWDRAGQNRGLWIALPVAGLVILLPPGLGVALAVAYFAVVRPKLRAAAGGQ